MIVSNEQIAEHWGEAPERCWRCGYKSGLEQCHIVPASLGGGDSADNLVLLCGRCHNEAPNHQDPQYLWRWLRATRTESTDTYWTIRGWEEFEVMFGRKPLSCFTDAGDLTTECRELAADEFAKTVDRFGEGLNPSTIACMIAEVEKKLAQRHGITLPDAA
ncbi:HNH endonuclease [Lentzea aerocolonigenes]|uniref:HNH endonuclease n=1 Tax=Lentzea aerocolonigenes TaxID=68170 RepID=UPI0005EBF8C5|nr:HNH endonuclease signature motif containing protein [Lentzea aerocolonigenes]